MFINYSTTELDLLARLMRAEALGEGNLGMLMVGNVVVNRALVDCLTFKNVRSIHDAIYQKNCDKNFNRMACFCVHYVRCCNIFQRLDKNKPFNP